MATLTADDLLDSSRFANLDEQYVAICGASLEVMIEMRMKIPPELKERLSTWDRTFTYKEGDVRQWDYQRAPLGYRFHIYDNCHFCKISCGGTTAYQIMKNGKWEASCNCCRDKVEKMEEVPRPDYQCILHFRR